MFQRLSRTFLGALPVALALSVGAAPVAHAEPKAGGTLTTFTSGYRTLNPAVQSGAATGGPGSQIFAGLVTVGQDYKIQPYLAKDWEVSADQLTVTFNLVSGAKFHDGAPITGEDVKFSLETVKANHPFGAAMFGNVGEIDVPSPETVVIHLNQPVPGLLLSMQPLLMPILPKHVYGDGQDMKTHPRNMENVVGSGPFKVEENNPAERLVLVKNEDFFIEGRPYLDKIVYPMVKDPLTRVLMLEKGEIDFAPFSGIRPTDVARIERAEGVNLTTDGYDPQEHAEQIDAVRAVAREALERESDWSALAQAGLLGLGIPEEHGGDGLGLLEVGGGCLGLLEHGDGGGVAQGRLGASGASDLVLGALPLLFDAAVVEAGVAGCALLEVCAGLGVAVARPGAVGDLEEVAGNGEGGLVPVRRVAEGGEPALVEAGELGVDDGAGVGMESVVVAASDGGDIRGRRLDDGELLRRLDGRHERVDHQAAPPRVVKAGVPRKR